MLLLWSALDITRTRMSVWFCSVPWLKFHYGMFTSHKYLKCHYSLRAPSAPRNSLRAPYALSLWTCSATRPPRGGERGAERRSGTCYALSGEGGGRRRRRRRAERRTYTLAQLPRIIPHCQHARGSPPSTARAPRAVRAARPLARRAHPRRHAWSDARSDATARGQPAEQPPSGT